MCDPKDGVEADYRCDDESYPAELQHVDAQHHIHNG
jgi:hypothetical protein